MILITHILDNKDEEKQIIDSKAFIMLQVNVIAFNERAK